MSVTILRGNALSLHAHPVQFLRAQEACVHLIGKRSTSRRRPSSRAPRLDVGTWRTTDPKQRAKAARREFVPPREQADGQLDLLEGIA